MLQTTPLKENGKWKMENWGLENWGQTRYLMLPFCVDDMDKLKDNGTHLVVVLRFAVGTLVSGLLYSAAVYAPIVLYYDANGNLEQRSDGSGTAQLHLRRTRPPADREGAAENPNARLRCQRQPH